MRSRARVVALALVAIVAPAASLAAPPDPVAAAIEQTFRPETRAQGIAALELLVPMLPAPGHARLALARALSWEGRLDESLRHYGEVLRDLPSDQRTAAELERLQVLLWLGRLGDAEDGYLRLLRSHPRQVEALVGLARARRWQGRAMASLEPARRALALAPEDVAARQEVAFVYLDLGMPYAARSALGGAEAPDELAERLRRTRRPAVSLSATGAAESSGIERLAVRTTMELLLPHDAGLAVGTGLSHLQQDSSSLQYRIAGGTLAMQWTRIRFGIGGAVYQGDDILLGEGNAWLGIRLGERASFSMGARRRPLVEAVEPLATGESAFFAAGAGGATDISAVARRGVDDLALTLQLAPVTAGYVYASGHGFAVTDGNRGYSLATGFGLDLVRMVGVVAPVALLVRGDSYFTGYEVQRADYFSPERFDGHMAGGQIRWQPAGPLALSAHAGRTFSVGNAAAAGWAAGGGLEWGIRDWKLAARAEYRDDLYHRVRRGWLAVTGPL